MSSWGWLSLAGLPDLTRGVHRSGGRDLIAIGAYGGKHQSGIDSGRFSGRIGDVYELLRAAAKEGDVVIEGTLVASTSARMIAITKSEQLDLRVLCLVEPLPVCIDGMLARKAARHHRFSSRPVNEERLEEKRAASEEAATHFIECGVPVYYVSRETGYAQACLLLGVSA